MATLVELILVLGPLFALRVAILDFYTRGSFIYLAEGILPWEVRVISTFALILPILFLVIAVVSILMAAIFRDMLERTSKILAEAIRGVQSLSRSEVETAKKR